MDYTIIGNEVNLAARLQTLAEPGEIVIAHETYALVREEFAATEAEPRVVKGFDKPVRNYVVNRLADGSGRDEPSHNVSKNGLRITLDLAAMSSEERAQATTEIQRLLDYLNVCD